jgi:hypothetical protein
MSFDHVSAFARLALSSLALCTACSPIGGADAGDGDGETGDGDGDPEPLGEPLALRPFCPDVAVSGFQVIPDVGMGDFGPCGDALLHSDGQVGILLPIDGEPQSYDAWRWQHDLSPRGRLLGIHKSNGTLVLRDLDAQTQVSVPLDEDGIFGFVISKSAPGARAWLCSEGTLSLLVDDELVSLADNVNCEVITTSGMHSQMVFATLDNTVMWVDTDEQTVTPTSLPDFVHGPDWSRIGERRDVLTMSTVGPYVFHNKLEVQDNDGRPGDFSIGAAAFDLEHDRVIAPAGGGYQAPVFGAPLFFLIDEELFGVVDGVPLSLATAINPWHVRPTADGSVLTIEAGEVVRHSGPIFEIRDTLLDANPPSYTFMMASSGESGIAFATTDTCVTPACDDMLHSIRRFTLDGFVDQLLSARRWEVLHVADDGTIVAEAAPVDGPFDTNVEPPDSRLVIIGQDGTILGELSHNPDVHASAFEAPLADGRLLVSLATDDGHDQLFVIDLAAATIEPNASFYADPESGTSWQVYRVDAMGRRVVIDYQRESQGIVWGELP